MSMQDMLDDIVTEETECKSFIIDDITKAEWAVKKIEQETIKLEQYLSVCKSMMDSYKEKMEKARQQFENSISYLRGQLESFFNTVDKKITKTQESFALPSGKLVLKYSKPKFEINHEELTRWLKENNKKWLIKTKEEPDWAELKKEVDISGNCVVTEDGEIVEGVIVETTEPVFEIKF